MNTKLVKTQQTILFIAGALLILVGLTIFISPVSFFASSNIEIGENLSLLNELKAPAGMLLVAGLFMIGAIFVGNMIDSATWLAALIYLSYAASRFASMIFDGVPAAGLVQAAVLESIVGFACLLVLMFRGVPATRSRDSYIGNRIDN